jgi:hypothetical protein
LHNELESLRNKLAAAQALNDYFRKQIEIHHITYGNVDLLIEMAQELNFTKEELDAYKDKLARAKDVGDSVIKSVLTSGGASTSSTTDINSGSYFFRFFKIAQICL